MDKWIIISSVSACVRDRDGRWKQEKGRGAVFAVEEGPFWGKRLPREWGQVGSVPACPGCVAGTPFSLADSGDRT